jgi:Tfp pilus assembly protein PilN
VLSSFGIGNFFNYLNPQDSGIALLVDIDANNIEVVVTARQKVLFSRHFKLNHSQPDWRPVFVNEIIKTQDAYLKEVQGSPITKVVILGEDNFRQEHTQALRDQAQFVVEFLSLDKKIDMPEHILNKLIGTEASFFSLLGLGLGTQEDSLNLLPLELKEEASRRGYNRRRLKTVSWLGAILLIWAIAIAKNLNNKARYLTLLKNEVNKLAKEARPLEEAEKRFKILENRNAKQVLILDILQELYRILPTAISLNTLSYDENSQTILRGQTAELNSVFSFVAQLEGSAAFKRYNIKVRYATKKKIQTGEIVDFEIVCLKR